MTKLVSIGSIVVTAAVSCALAFPQAAPQKEPDPAQLQLTMEVATTTEDGAPAALRLTLTNIGDLPVDIPLPVVDCSSPSGSISLVRVVKGRKDVPPVHGCGIAGGSSVDGKTTTVVEMIKSSWFHLRPGESLALTGDARRMLDLDGLPATYEYWAVYDPPRLTADQRDQAERSGLLIPRENVESAHLSFSQN